MPRLNKEENRAYAKAHYTANKANYNPARTKASAERAEQVEDAYNHAERLIAESMARYVYPDEVPHVSAAVDARIYSAGYLPPEARAFGLFQGRPPFAHKPVHIQRSFLRHLGLIPKSKRGIHAEILILTLVSKGL